MSRDKGKVGGQDGERIDVSEDHGLRGWAKKFDTTPEQIKHAVAAVGDGAADVEIYLKGTHATTNADQEARADMVGKSRRTDA